MTGISAFLGISSAVVEGQEAAKHLTAAFRVPSVSRPAPSSRVERLAAYRLFEHAAVDFLVNQQSVRSMVPSIKGGLWSVPVHFRRLHDMDTTLRQLVHAISDVRLVGNEQVIDAAKRMMSPLTDLASVKAPQRASEVEGIVATMKPLVDSFGDAFSDFVSAAREDLGHDQWRKHFWQIWRPQRPKSAEAVRTGSSESAVQAAPNAVIPAG
jgi:hypothetical protein